MPEGTPPPPTDPAGKAEDQAAKLNGKAAVLTSYATIIRAATPIILFILLALARLVGIDLGLDAADVVGLIEAVTPGGGAGP